MLGISGTLATLAGVIAGAGVLLIAWLVSIWLVCAALVALGAYSRGRSVPLWLFLAILLTPLPAAVMLLLFPDRSELRQRRDAKLGRDGWRLCPSCSEVVRAEARRCRFCLADLTRRVDALPRQLSPERVEPRLQ